nr:MAG TPA: hypothetical protein [Caudoviricetes sp.]
MFTYSIEKPIIDFPILIDIPIHFSSDKSE